MIDSCPCCGEPYGANIRNGCRACVRWWRENVMADVGPFRTAKGACEMCSGRHVSQAEVCAIWREAGEAIVYKHRHLCSPHASVIRRGYGSSESWAEQSVDQCLSDEQIVKLVCAVMEDDE